MGVSLDLGGSLTGSRVPSRNHWGLGMGSIFLLRLTPVRWVSVLKRNTSCSFSGVDPAISPRTTIRSGSGNVDPDIAPCTTIHSFLFRFVRYSKH